MTPSQEAMHSMLSGTMFEAYDASDRKKNPTPIPVRQLTEEEVRNLTQGGWYEFVNGGFNKNAFTIRRVRVSSVNYRGRGKDRHIEFVKMKYGLKEYWDWSVEECMTYLITRLETK